MSRARLAGSALISLVDQAAYVCSNFILVIAMARALPTAEFGKFSTALLLVGTISLFMRSTLGTTAMLNLSGEPSVGKLHARDAMRVTSLVALAITGASVVWVSLASPAAHLAWLMIVGTVSLVSDQARVLALANDRLGLSLVASGVWAVLIGGSAVLSNSPSTHALVWAGGAAVAASLYSLALGGPPTDGSLRSRLQADAMALRHLAAGAATTVAHRNLLVWLLASFAGFEVVGGLRAGQALFRPATIVNEGMTTGVAPLLRRRRVQGTRVGGECLAAGGLAVAVAGATWMLFLVRWPGSEPIGQTLVGDSWSVASSLAPALMTVRVGAALALAGTLALLALADTARLARLKSASAAVSLAGGVVGGLLFGASGAAWGLALAGGLMAPLWAKAIRGL